MRQWYMGKQQQQFIFFFSELKVGPYNFAYNFDRKIFRSDRKETLGQKYPHTMRN